MSSLSSATAFALMMPLSLSVESVLVPLSTMVPEEPCLNLMALSPSLASVRSSITRVTPATPFFTAMLPFAQLPVTLYVPAALMVRAVPSIL